MTDIYTNEMDEKDRPIKHTHIPENAKVLIESLTRKYCEEFFVNSGLPRDIEKRQDFFHWLKNFRKYGNIVLGFCITTGLASALTFIKQLIKIIPQ